MLRAGAAKATLERRKKTRLEILEEAARTPCACKHHFEDEGRLYRFMTDIIAKNPGADGFQKAVIESLRYGRGKMHNLCVVGPTNAGKSVLVKSLEVIFRAFSPPDATEKFVPTYPLLSLLGKEVLLFNEYKFSLLIMSWETLKELLEGDKIILVPTPRNTGKGEHSDVQWKSDAPWFGSARHIIKHDDGSGRENPDETTQANNRIRYFHLTHQYEVGKDCQDSKTCASCAARFYLEGLPPPTKRPADGPTGTSPPHNPPRTGSGPLAEAPAPPFALGAATAAMAPESLASEERASAAALGTSDLRRWCQNLRLSEEALEVLRGRLEEEDIREPRDLAALRDADLEEFVEGLKKGEKGRFLNAVRSLRP